MFLDKVVISIKAGNGGNGHVSFYRDKLTMTGGPDGGNGGRGGNVVFVGTTREDNLINFRYQKKFLAPDGVNGGKRNQAGANGENLVIQVPLGTKIYKNNNEKDLLADILVDGQEYVALRGGSGGRGNAFYATAKKQTPNFSQTGIITKEYSVLLELDTIADIGLVGFPNVGKSTLLSVISNANPKIGNYHFTTLFPNVGVVNMFGKNVVVADIPGIIEGASEGVGLGLDFLRHVSRTRLLIHVVDISESEGREAVSDFETINKELLSYSQDLANLPQIIALNKVDQAKADVIKAFRKKYGKKYPIFELSAVINLGVEELMKEVVSAASKLPKKEIIFATATLEDFVDRSEFVVENIEGEFWVSGGLVDNLIRGVVLTDTESFAYFQRRLVDSGIMQELKKQGMVEGNVVHIGEVEFEYLE
ncbi:MAG: GTPase ObgE [Firmicutes bacterium]|nr:GTPase ObgE [Bacillota bacterium]